MLATAWCEPEQARGIARFAKEAGWRLDLAGPETASLLSRWDGDGIICQLHGSQRSLVARVRAKKGVPKVGLSLYLPGAAAAHVVHDYRAMGRLAAEHLLDRGFRYFAFCGWDKTNWHRRLRRRGVIERLAAAGHKASPLSCPDPNSPQAQRAGFDSRRCLAHQVTALPVPLGVAADDARLATRLVDGCSSVGLLVPEQVAIVSLSDDLLICEFGRVPLSAISVDYEEQGYRAAALLDRLMDGAAPPGTPVLVPPRSLIVRHSSDITAIENKAVARAVKFIMDNMGRQDLYVPAVVAASGVSKTTLTREFVRHVGRPIAAEIRRLRLDKAMRLIRESPLSFTRIAEVAGYSSLKHLERSVRRASGLCPRHLRRRHHAAGHPPA